MRVEHTARMGAAMAGLECKCKEVTLEGDALPTEEAGLPVVELVGVGESRARSADSSAEVPMPLRSDTAAARDGSWPVVVWNGLLWGTIQC